MQTTSNISNKIYGYCRVSTKDQNLDRQIVAMKNNGIDDDCIFCDKESGKNFNRKNFKKMLRKLKEGDTLVIMSIDRLGRDYDAIGKMWKKLALEKKIQIKVLDMPILNTTSNTLVDKLLSDIILQLLAFVAQAERDNLLKRQEQGIQAAKDRGVKFGRPMVELPDNFLEICINWHNKKINTKTAIEMSGLSQRTFYRKSKEMLSTLEKQV